MSDRRRPWGMQPLTRLLCLAIGLTAVLAACSSGGAGSSPSSSPPPGDANAGIDGRTFLSTAVQGATLVPGTRVSLMFTNGSLSASGGCNSMGGSYTLTGGRLSIGQMMTTDMGCDPARMQQDQWLAALLDGATVTLAGDTLTLQKGPVTLTLLDRKVANPDKPITGTHWVLDGIVSGDTASSVPAGATASIHIADGRIDVDTGCNTGGGTVEVTATTLKVGDLALTKKACQAGPAGVESAVTTVLRGTPTYTIDADTLTLTAGAAGLTFRATQ